MAQATLNGQIVDDGGGAACMVRFEWGTDKSYGVATDWKGSFASGDTFSATIYNLGEGVLYHFRAVARNPIGISYGQDMSFVTLIAEGIPVLMDDAALLRFLEVS